MKKILMLMTAAVLSLPLVAQAEVHEKVIGVTDVYIPSGFDSSSDAFVVVNGLLMNSCYQLKDARVEDGKNGLKEVTITANVTEGVCLMVLVPFHKEVQLGKLAVGQHTIHFMNGDGTYLEKQITIEQ